MAPKHHICILVITLLSAAGIGAQTQLSVPMDAAVYHALEQAALRGLCGPLPETRPYSRQFIVETIDVILQTDKTLSSTERMIFEAERGRYAQTGKRGLDIERGVFRFEDDKTGAGFGLELGLNSDLSFSGKYDSAGGFMSGYEAWLSVRVAGDLGPNLSYRFPIGVGILSAKRPELGLYATNIDDPAITKNISGNPEAYFPYSYRGRWDGWLFPMDNLTASGPTGWPNSPSMGFTLQPEFAGVVLNNVILFRLGRIDRDWGGVAGGSSLALNRFAQPFFGVDVSVTPLSWFRISGLTGILEYENTEGIQVSSRTFQNAFSLTLFEINYQQYVSVSAGSSTVWPKRFELGYLFPLMDKLLYQNNVGDFDNMAIFGSLKLQKPGLGYVWFSLFLDESSPGRNFFELDRQMYAFQGGLRFNIPKLPLTALTLSYTKIEPYCYTHQPLDNTPWYGNIPVEERYTNHGYGLGYYLPPNADEIKVRFESMPAVNTRYYTQFQLIRHGADHGESAVDGSSYYSNLPSGGRNDNPQLRKFFLHDGAYQWQYILKGGGSYRLRSIPVEFHAEAGAVLSYYTNIETGKNNTGAAYPENIIDTREYPRTASALLSLGVRIFP